MPEDLRASQTYDLPVAPRLFTMNGRTWISICRIHKRALCYSEFMQQKCHWCNPELAEPFLSDGRTKNPCYNHEQNRHFTKEEMSAILEEQKHYRKKSNG